MIIPILIALIASAILLLTAGIHLGRHAERSRASSRDWSPGRLPTPEKNDPPPTSRFDSDWIGKPSETITVVQTGGTPLRSISVMGDETRDMLTGDLVDAHTLEPLFPKMPPMECELVDELPGPATFRTQSPEERADRLWTPEPNTGKATL